MKRIIVLTLVVVLAMVMGACAPAAAPGWAPAAPSAPLEVAPAAPELRALGGAPDQQAAPAKPATTATDRLIVRTAQLALVVKDSEEALGRVRSIASALGGFVADSKASRDAQDRMRVTVTLRIPAESFDKGLEQIKAIAVKVTRENISGRDVTEEYTDLGARLRNLEAAEKELLQLLTEVRQKTGKAEDVLAVYDKLNSVRGQIEQLKGRMNYLDQSVALATLTIELTPAEVEKPLVEPMWEPLRTARDAFRALTSALQMLVNLVIWFIVFALPILLIVASPFVVLVWWLRRARRKKAVA